jgi:hypothetical protein
MPNLTVEEFQKQAEQNGLKNVTEEEYDDHVKAHPKLSVYGSINRIRNSRKSNYNPSEGKDTQILIAYALGGYDFTSKEVSFKETKTQYLILVTRDGEVKKVSCRGNFTGHHGRLCEFELHKDPEWRYWKIGGVKTMEEQWQGERSEKHWKTIQEYIDYENDPTQDRELCFIKGTLRGAFPIRNWDERDENDDYLEFGIDQAGKSKGMPCASALLRDDGIAVYGHFGPYKNAKPLIRKMPDWSLDVCESHTDLKMATSGQTVGLIGEFHRVTHPKTKDGEEYTKLELKATGIVGFPFTEEDPVEEATVEEKPKSAGQKKAAELMEKIRLAHNEIGPEITVEMVKKSKYVDTGKFSDEHIKKAIENVKEESASPPPPKKDTKKLSVRAKRVYKFIQKNGDEIEIDDVIENFKDSLSEDAVEKYLETLIDNGLVCEPSLGKVKVV